LYRNPLSMSFEDSQKRFGPLTQMEELGLVNFGDNERFHVVCSQHEDYLGVGYFFRFTPARLTASGQIEYPNFRNRVAKILGADFLDFLSKMPR